MPTRKNLIIAAASLMVGLLGGALIAASNGRDRSKIATPDERSSLSALAKDPSRALVLEISELMPTNLHGNGGSTRAWAKISTLELGELTDLIRHLDRRSWLSGTDAYALEMAMERWGMLDPEGALDWIESGTHTTTVRASYRRVFASLATQDLGAAIERLDVLPKKFRDPALGGLARPFAEADPARAAQYFIDLGKSVSWASREVAETWARNDPVAAIAFYSAGESYLVRAVVAQWGEDDAEGALDWVTGQELDPAVRNNYIREIASRTLRKDPLAALTMLENIPAGIQRNDAMMRLLDTWGKKDADAAVAWAQALEDPAAKARALKEISESIRSINPELALELAEALPSAEFRNQAFESYADARAEKDPEGALAWAEALEDEDRRRSAITASIAGLAPKDLVKATDYIIGTADQTHKKEMFAKIISADNLGVEQMDTAREIVKKLSKEDEKLAVDTILEINGQYMPKPVKALLKLTGDLETFLDWADKMHEDPFQ